MTERHDNGLVIKPIEANYAPLPGAVLNENMHDWIELGLTAEQMLAKVIQITGQTLAERDVSALTGWIRDEKHLAAGFSLRHELDLSRPVDDIAAARVAMRAAGIDEPNQPAQGEQ